MFSNISASDKDKSNQDDRNELKKRREDNAVEIRKNNRESIFNKKRNINP